MNNKLFVNKVAYTANLYPDKIFSSPRKIYTCVNPYSYHLLRQHINIYDTIDGLFVDGMLMCLLIRLLWRTKILRLSFDMTTMAADLFDYLNKSEKDLSIYFVGAKQKEIEGSVTRIRLSYPNMKIVGFRNGYFDSDSMRKQAIENIIKLNPDFTVIGMGALLQEAFAIDLKKRGYQGIAFTCGGFLHQTSTQINYYPQWINRFNLRAFYRLFHEKGMIKRLYYVLIEFPLLFTWDTLISVCHRTD
jgi:N-acetylglucosaminyldiphosphoundecaprenol N-acetyl-beta-D-mannosaminyltransferase